MSVNNLIFIGDNLTVLNNDLLKDYIGKVKIIYIDPPYNTKSDKSYNDNISSNIWLNQISERIRASYKYLSAGGVYYISIDDNEYAYLKIECDKIFGINNFIGTFITHQAQRSNSKLINTVHEYILCYAKDKSKVKEFKIKRLLIPEQKEYITYLVKTIKAEFNNSGYKAAHSLLLKEIKRLIKEKNALWLKNYTYIDNEGNIFYPKDLSTPTSPRTVNIPSIRLYLDPLPTRGWSSDSKFIDLYNKGLLYFKGNRPYKKALITDTYDNTPSILPFYSRQGTHDLEHLGLQGIFDTAKPVSLIKYLIRLIADNNDIIMDFYAGSGTTAQAVYEINKENNTYLSYILIQQKEIITDKKIKSVCEREEIYPDISEVLKLRLNRYLEKSLQQKDYKIIDTTAKE